MLTDIHDVEHARRNYIIVIFIYLSIFINSYVFFKQPFEFYFGYLIFVVLLPSLINRFGFNGNLFFIFLILLVSGLVNVFLGNNTTALFFKVFSGLTMSYFFYYYIIVDSEYNIQQLFNWYLKGAYIAALIGIVQFISFTIGFKFGYDYTWIFNKWGVNPGGLFGIRVNSVFAEPTYLGTVLSAAFFISVYNLTTKESYYYTRFQSVAVIITYLLSFSSLGQTGIFLTFLFLTVNFGLVRYMAIFIPAAIILFNVLYINVLDFRERLDGLVSLFSGKQFQVGVEHGSSFQLYNNYIVATKNFETNFVFGTGIGSHPIAFDKYSLGKNIKIEGFDLNSSDANSMLLRLLSETGLFGVFIFLFIIFKYYVRRDPENDTFHWLVSNSILVMMSLNLFRQGHYFLNGFPFFVLLYVFNHFAYKEYLEENQNAIAEDDTERMQNQQIQ